MTSAINTAVTPITGDDGGPFPDGLANSGIPASLAALGSTQATAALITSKNTMVTGADGSKGVVLPVPAYPGEERFIFNSAASDLKIWPAVGGYLVGATNAPGKDTNILMEDYSAAILMAQADLLTWAVIYTAG